MNVVNMRKVSPRSNLALQVLRDVVADFVPHLSAVVGFVLDLVLPTTKTITVTQQLVAP